MKYTISTVTSISISTEVEADTQQQALDIAMNRNMQHLPPNHNANPDNEWCHSGELDGVPSMVDITIDTVSES